MSLLADGCCSDIHFILVKLQHFEREIFWTQDSAHKIRNPLP